MDFNWFSIFFWISFPALKANNFFVSNIYYCYIFPLDFMGKCQQILFLLSLQSASPFFFSVIFSQIIFKHRHKIMWKTTNRVKSKEKGPKKKNRVLGKNINSCYWSLQNIVINMKDQVCVFFCFPIKTIPYWMTGHFFQFFLFCFLCAVSGNNNNHKIFTSFSQQQVLVKEKNENGNNVSGRSK